MRNRCGFSIGELLAALAVLGVLLAVLVPIVARSQDEIRLQTCQNNLRILGAAIQMYANDNNGVLPTNRLSPTQPITQNGLLNRPDGTPGTLNFVNGLELYFPEVGVPSTHSGVMQRDDSSIWKCPMAEGHLWYWPTANGIVNGYGDSRVTYAINFNLLEKARTVAAFPGMTPIMREIGINGQAYAFANTTNPQTIKPANIFLTNQASWGVGARRGTQTPHGAGSHILMLDGRVQWFENSVMQDSLVVKTPIPDSQLIRWSLCEEGDPARPILHITP